MTAIPFIRLLYMGHFLVILLLCASPCQSETSLSPDISRVEILRLGERMYRDGILPSGEVMEAYIKDDVKVDSSAFSCSSCHLRSGLGSVEGGVITPPTNGTSLYKPYQRPPSLEDIPDKAGRYIYAKTVTKRPAYTRETLATALRFGKDPANQVFNDVMPRYPLNDKNMAILISYLEALSSEPSPGASNKEIFFATIITDEVSQEDRQALLAPLQSFISLKNQQVKMFNDFIKFGYTPTVDMKYAFRQASLDVWELKGPQETWKGQLAEYYKRKPVFAILGGISTKDWKPIHEFCEQEQLPCLFPITNFPVLSPPGWYTYYFNKGFAQEGEAVAHYLNRLEGISRDTPILQIIQDSPTGKALATGFQNSWDTFDRTAVTTITLTGSQIHDQSAMSAILKNSKAQVLILWADAEILPNLTTLISYLPSSGMIFVSSGYLGKNTTRIEETIRNKVYITYPYRLTPYVGPKTGGIDARVPILASSKDFGSRRIESRSTDVLKQAILNGVSLLNDNLYRDNLMDIMSMQMDIIVRDYERLSFGPGQRYVSKGCYIIQLGPGTEPELLPRSEWVVH